MTRVNAVLELAFVGLMLRPGAVAACPADSVESGTICMDKYEASVWFVPPERQNLINRIQRGTVTLANLTSPGAVAAGVAQLGLVAGDLAAAGCSVTGNGCVNFYAVSINGITPSTNITWFQAAAAARNASKRLPTNQEWQVAALGTPDSPDGFPCLTLGPVGPSATGTAGCVSDVGAFDMVGNVFEWVADWTTLTTGCALPIFPDTEDSNCFGDIVALTRGGFWDAKHRAGVFQIDAVYSPAAAVRSVGFRGVR